MAVKAGARAAPPSRWCCCLSFPVRTARCPASPQPGPGVSVPWAPPTALPRPAAAGRGGEHFPGVIRGGAVNPDRRYLIARRPAAPGTGTGANPPPASSSPRSLLTLRQRQHWKRPLQPPRTPARLPPLTGLWGSPTGKGGSWQGAGAGTPPLLLPPQCRALTHPRQELLPPSFAPGPLQRGQRGETPNTLDLCSGLLQPPQ